MGTQTLRHENQIHQLNYDDETRKIERRIFAHPRGEIWHLAASPRQADLLVSCFNTVTTSKAEINAAVFRLPTAAQSGVASVSEVFDSTGSSSPVQELVELRGHASNVRGVAWHPLQDGRLATIDQTNLYTWDLDVAGKSAKVSGTAKLPKAAERDLHACRWSPHQNGTVFATANDTAVRGWDLRSMQETFCIRKAHEQCSRSMDFNPNMMYYLVTGGDDCKLKFWDMRSLAHPLLQLTAHSHWVWSVRYNHSYDQLLLSSGSDGMVVLSSVASLSAPLYSHTDADAEDSLADSPKKDPIADGIVAVFEEHEDSVYSAEWSMSESVPWVFASVSYDGRVVVNQVPKDTKLKVFL